MFKVHHTLQLKSHLASSFNDGLYDKPYHISSINYLKIIGMDLFLGELAAWRGSEQPHVNSNNKENSVEWVAYDNNCKWQHQ